MKCLPPEKAFLGLEPQKAVPYEKAKAVIIPFGLERSVSYGGGTAQGPAAMIEASLKWNYLMKRFGANLIAISAS